MASMTPRARIIEMAERAFGVDGADPWLHTRWRMFGNRTPLDLAADDREARKVEDFIANLMAADEMMLEAGYTQVAL